MSTLSLPVNSLGIVCGCVRFLCEWHSVSLLRSQTFTHHTLQAGCGAKVDVCTCADHVLREKKTLWSDRLSLWTPPRTTQSAPARACLVSVTMSRCWCHWAYRNWSVECLIDQTRQPLRWLSVRRSFSQSLSLWGPYLCCVFLLWLSVSLTKKELFLLKLTALNFRDKLAMTYMWQTLCFSQGCRV